MRKAARQCGRKFGCFADAHGVATQTFRDPDKIDAGQIEAWHVAYLHHLAERAHRAIACIVDHHHRQRQFALRRRPQRLDRIHRGAVADQTNGPGVGVGKRDAEYANAFIADLASRMANRIQLTSDGLSVYLAAVERAFHGRRELGRFGA